MAGSDSTFVLVATYPDEEMARYDYQKVRDAHGAGLVGSYDAAIGAIFPPSVLGTAALGGVIGGVSGHLAKGMSRSDAKELGDFIDPGEAGLVVVGENKVQDAIKKAVTRAEKQTSKDLTVDPKNVDRTLQEAVGEM